MKKAVLLVLGLSLAIYSALTWTAMRESMGKAGEVVPEPCDQCSEEPPQKTTETGLLAVVNDRKITEADLRLQFYLMKKQILDQYISNLLLEQEAKRKGTTPQELLKAEVLAREKPIADEEARKFYQENKAQIRGDFETVKAQLIQSLQNRQRQQLAQNFVNQLRAKAGVKVFLVEPTFSVSSPDDPARGGSREAAITVVEFTDFQ